jgi:predicted nuclease of predicted toxin-antitoxin system
VATIKLDENVPDSVADILRQEQHDVSLARDEQLAGVVDEDLLEVASSESRVLVTLDRDFSNTLRHPPEGTAGIVVIRLGEQTVPRIRECAVRLAKFLTSEPVQGRLWIIDEARLRIWPRSNRASGERD